jgi:Na+-driven multidrug efflux pump
VVFLPAVAVARGVETMTGQNIGADEYDRAERTNYAAAKGLFVILTAAGIAIFLVPAPIVGVFTDDPAVIDEGATFLRFTALSFGFIGGMRAFTGGFRGAGKTITAAAISVFTVAVARLPVAWVASQSVLPTEVWFLGAPTPKGIWLAFAVSNITGAALAWFWFRRGTWREADVTDSPPVGDAGAEADTVSTDD